MKKLLPLLCFAFLPLSASALLQNATASAEVLPHADDKWVALRAAETAKLKELVETRLAKMPDLSGVYVGIIEAREPSGDNEPMAAEAVELLRIVRLQEGANSMQIADDKGTLSIEMTLKPDRENWDLGGKIDYYGHGSQTGRSMSTSSVAPANLAVFLGQSRAMRQLIREKEASTAAPAKAVVNAQSADAENDMISGYFFLRTADAPDPRSSQANPIHRVGLPSGAEFQLDPGLSPAQKREVIAAALAKDKAATAAARATPAASRSE